MSSFLLLTVYAPLSSWGDIAVGEDRSSWDRPSRSAILGLLGAALGVERSDQEGHDALESGFGLAVRLDAQGSPMSEFQTVQSADESLVRRHAPATRREVLAIPGVEAILTRREHHQDALATVAVWQLEASRWSLDQLSAALSEPAFVLYAGRKANALGLPLHPVVVDAITLASALHLRQALPEMLDGSRLKVIAPAQRDVMHDTCEGFDSGLTPVRRVVRRDVQANRSRWQFAERVAWVSVPSAGTAA